MRRRLLFVLIAMLLPMIAIAYDVEVDGIYYNLVPKAKVAEVTSGENRYTGQINIPATIEYDGATYDVTIIGENALAYCTTVTDVKIPYSIVEIRNQAFIRNYGLETVEIPGTVVDIGGGVFYECINLKEVTLGEGITTLGSGVFGGCRNLKKLEIPQTVISIGSGLVDGCTSLESLTLPNTLEFWDNSYTCRNCSSLTTLKLPDNTGNISQEFFSYCSKLGSIEIPQQVEYIGEKAFFGCTNLKSIVLPNVVKFMDIASCAFMNYKTI